MLTDAVTEKARLDREEQSRQAAGKRNETLNFPHDVAEPISAFPEGFGVVGGAPEEGYFSNPVRVDEREVSQLGGKTEWLELMMGEPDFVAHASTEDAERIKEEWEAVFEGKPFPYDIGEDNLQTREIELALALKDLERDALGKMARGEVWREMTVEPEGEVLRVFVDTKEITNLKVREALQRLGGLEHIRSVWGNAKELTLLSPGETKQNLGWAIKIENERKESIAMSLRDFERMFYVEDEKERKQIVLPKPGDGTYAGTRDLVLALKRLQIVGGSTLPDKIDIALELLR